MRHLPAVLFTLLCLLPFGGCAGGNTGIALGYGHHGPGIAVFTDNLWYTPHQAGVSVPLGWESGSYSHAPAAPSAPAVSAAAPSAPAVSAAAPVSGGQGAGPVTGYAEPPRAAPAASTQPGYAAAEPHPSSSSGPGAPNKPGTPDRPGAPDGPSSRLAETPPALEPPDLSYRP